MEISKSSKYHGKKMGLGIGLVLVALLGMVGSAFAGPILMHNSNSVGTKFGTWGVTGGKYGNFTCTTCHNSTTTNIKRVAQTLTAPQGMWSSSKAATVSVTFDNVTGTIGVGFGNDAGGHATSVRICEVCHTRTAVHKYNTAGQTDLNHKTANNRDCTGCHSHSLGFASSCDTCHGFPPTSAAQLVTNPATTNATGGLAGAHAKHDLNGRMKCETCHTNYNPNHPSDGSKNINMGFVMNNANVTNFGSTPVTTGSYTPNSAMTNGFAFTATNAGTTINAAAANASTCNLYCHNPFTGNGGTEATPNWTSTTAGNCGTCHGVTPATAPNPPGVTSGAHGRHAGNAAGALSVPCASCHGTISNNDHVAGQVGIDITGLASSGSKSYSPVGGTTGIVTTTGKIAPSATYGTCNNIYCHSSVQSGADGKSAETYPSTQPTWGGTALNCTNSCHAGTAATLTTGSHTRHISGGTNYNYVCNDCHNLAGDETAKHADGHIDISMAQGKYSSAGAGANAYKLPKSGYSSCLNTACHANAPVAPRWGAGALAGGCNACHGNKANATRLSGAHNKHMNDVNLGGSFTCGDCHANVALTDTALVNQALHANNLINYSGAKAGAKFAGVSPVTCSVQYCHSNGKGTSATVPAWTGTFGAATCYSCHGTSGTTGAPDNSTPNSHAKHNPTASDCWKCHFKTASKTAGQLAAGTVDHLDKTLDARLAVPFSYTNMSGVYNGAKTCSTTYCHGTAATPAWGTAGSTNCNSCHKSKWNGSVGLPGAHKFHVTSSASNYTYSAAPANNSSATAYNFNCGTCHAAGASKAVHFSGPASSTTGAAQVFFGYTNAVMKGTYTYGGTPTSTDNGFIATNGAGCNTTYCHSSGRNTAGATNPDWSVTTGAGTCTQCHGGKTTGTLSGAHAKHVNDPNLGGAFGCVDCHANTVSNDTTILASGGFKNHVNKLINYSGAKAGAKFAGVSPVTCSVQYCHSNGKGTSATVPAWTGTFGAATCYSCHGTSGTTGAPDNSTPNSHAKHNPTASDCWKCHFKTASKTAGQLAAGNVDHLDRNIDARLAVPFSYTNMSGVYNGAKTCSTTYCHGTAATPAWGTAGSTNCNSCHKSKWNGSVGLPGAHKFHVTSSASNYTYSAAPANNSSATAYNFNCGTCHAAGASKAVHFSGPASATTGAAQVFFGYTNAVMKGTYIYGATPTSTDNGFVATNGTGCTTTYCHSNGRNGAGASDLAWSTTTGAGTCTQCHGGKTTGTLSGAHASHVNNANAGGNFGCVDCHATTVSADTTILANGGFKNHVNKLINYSGMYAGTNKTCANFYCHSNGSGTFVNPPTWTSGTTLACNGCHNGDTHGSPATGNHLKHMAATGASDCFMCHWTTTQAADTITTQANHINKSSIPAPGGNWKTTPLIAASFTIGGTAGPGNRTCSSISCHGGGTQAVTWGNTLGCDGCHPIANLSGAHSKHMGGINLTTLSGLLNKFDNFTANRSNGPDTTIAYGYGCANCHPIAESATHLDGSIQVQLNPVTTGNKAGTLRNLNTNGTNNGVYNGDKTCDVIYCHGDGKNPLVVGANGKTPIWTGAFANADRCANCHGNSPSTVAHAVHTVGIHTDDVFSGRSGKLPLSSTTNTVNAAHGFSRATTINCDTCHNITVTAPGNDKNPSCSNVANSCHGNGAPTKGAAAIGLMQNHVNGKVEVVFPAIYVKTKAQLRDNSFNSYTSVANGSWKRNKGYKNYTSSYDISKTLLNAGSVYVSGGNCTNSCHNNIPITWTAPTGDCTKCHTKL